MPAQGGVGSTFAATFIQITTFVPGKNALAPKGILGHLAFNWPLGAQLWGKDKLAIMAAKLNDRKRDSNSKDPWT